MIRNYDNVSTDPKVPWSVIRGASNGGGDFWNICDESQSSVSALWSKGQDSYERSISTALPPLNIRVRGQEPVGFLPEANECILEITGDEIDGRSVDQPSAVSIDRSRATVDTFKDIVKAWRKHLADHHFKGLNRRLEYIFEDEPEIGPKQAAPDPTSFSAMLAYLAAKPELKTPSIGFNRDGSFSATWVGEKKLRVTLDFIGLENTRWIFIDSRQGIEAAITGAGTVPNAILNGVLDSYGALDWMKV